MQCETCKNYPDKCHKCNGSLYYSEIKKHKKIVKYSQRKGSRLEEETIRAQPNSGATLFAKGDCISENILIECKSTTKKSYSIKKEELEKIFDQSRVEGRMPILNFGFEEKNGYNQIYSIVRYEDLLALITDDTKFIKITSRKNHQDQ